MHRLSQRRLWVHCAMNMRVTAFLGLYWANECGWDRAKAFELIRWEIPRLCRGDSRSLTFP
jgi:hypothetical protein